MMKNVSLYENSIEAAIRELKNKNYPRAEEQIKLAMLEDPHSPAVHNLYGILEELLMEDGMARKHYRAAYALDPTYKPAIRNLERISSFDFQVNGKPIDYGDEREEIIESPYVIKYDDHHVGHLYKKNWSE